MPIKAFATGVTGYIGGDAFHQINETYPGSIEWTCLVRNSSRGATIAARYPSVRLVYGDLDDTSLLEQEASQADLVCNWADADHLPAAAAILAGLETRAKTTNNNVYLIQTSGSAIIAYPDIAADRYGEYSEQTFNDWDGVRHLVDDIPANAPHRNVDQAILSHSSTSNNRVKTAIVCPPCIYGTGRGPANTASVQIPGLARLTFSQRSVVRVGKGDNVWSSVHVADLSYIYTALVGKALPDTPRSSADAPEDQVWGPRAYYFAATGQQKWGEVAEWIASEAVKGGFLSAQEAAVGNGKSLTRDEIDGLRNAGAMLWGTNSRCEAVRAGKVLGWNPKGRPSLRETIAEAVAIEAAGLGLAVGHAARAAGTA